MENKNKYLLLTLTIILLFIITVIFTIAGPEAHILKLVENNSTIYNLKDLIINIRLPRFAAALITGAGLAAAGVIFQALFRNPLADPYTAGISGGAAIGVALGVFLKFSSPLISINAFAGSLLSLFFILALRKKFSMYSKSLILAGISLSMICSSIVMLIYAVSDSREVHKAMLWLAGDLSIARFSLLIPSAIIIIFFIIYSIFQSRKLDIISLGENYSASLGVTKTDITLLFITASIITSATVLIAGVISFAGLMIPHIIRIIIGPSHRGLIFFSAISGALFIAMCDTIGKIAAYPFEVPAGIFAGIIGGIFFLILSIRRVS